MAGTNATDHAHAADDHGDPGGHGHDDHGGAVGHDDADAQEPLGPIDWWAWGAGVLGAVAAGVIAVALYLSAQHR